MSECPPVYLVIPPAPYEVASWRHYSLYALQAGGRSVLFTARWCDAEVIQFSKCFPN